MENEIIEVLNKNTVLLKQLISLVIDSTEKKKTFDWHDHLEAMDALKVSDSTLCRLRRHHPDHCKKIMGKWYYNLHVLMMIKL